MYLKKLSKIANQKFMVAETYMTLKSCKCCDRKTRTLSRVERLQEKLKGLLNDLRGTGCVCLQSN